MDLEALKNAAMNVADQAKQALSDEQAADSVLDKVADAASQLTGGKFDEQIEQARGFVDSQLGDK